MLGRLIGEHIDLRCDFDEDLPAIFADESNIEQIVMNLVVNARDAMPQGGQLAIRTEAVEIDRRARQPPSAGSPGRLRLPERHRHRLRHGRRRRSVTFSSRSSPPRKSAKAPASASPRFMASSRSTTAGSKSPARSAQGTDLQDFPSGQRGEAERRRAWRSMRELRGGDETILVVEDEPAVREIMTDRSARARLRVLAGCRRPRGARHLGRLSGGGSICW